MRTFVLAIVAIVGLAIASPVFASGNLDQGNSSITELAKKKKKKKRTSKTAKKGKKGKKAPKAPEGGEATE
ncbi:MAG: hypothetical protein H6707_07420 [Deltaproteobacteria bacterium]|nr:hypothetical protein [Deltaproteobacteria bacterium]